MRIKPSSQAKPLTILQANVGRAAIPHEIALSLASDSCIDIILIQELYIFTDLQRRITKSHPLYESFTPIDNWETRPRAISYVRKAKNSYWTTKLDSITDPTDVFRMTKWHQSTGTYRSPPLKDPQHPERPPTRSLEEKRNSLNYLQIQRKQGISRALPLRPLYLV
jgi:hypothetical protein